MNVGTHRLERLPSSMYGSSSTSAASPLLFMLGGSRSWSEW